MRTYKRNKFADWLTQNFNVFRHQYGSPPVPTSPLEVQDHRYQTERLLHAERERLLAVLHSIDDGVITANTDYLVDFLNPRATQLTGWSVTEACGQPLTQVLRLISANRQDNALDIDDLLQHIHTTPETSQEITLIDRAGKEHGLQVSIAPIHTQAGQNLGIVVVFRDITGERRLVQEMSYYATHDSLTGLANRWQFEQRLQQIVEETRRQFSQHALCYMDLDQFKTVNDSGGHLAGDELLRQIGALLRTQTRHEDILARLGGDEFGLIMEHCTLAQADRVINAIRKAIAEYRFIWQNKTFKVGVSMGLVPIMADSTSPVDLLKAADTACSIAKDTGRNRTHVYQPEVKGLAKQYRKVLWASRISEAMDENRLHLYCQPIVTLSTEQPARLGQEILVRLEEDDGELILPGAFMGAAERYRLAPRLDRWVVGRIFAWLAAHPGQTSGLNLYAINLSDQSLRDAEFARFVCNEARHYGIPSEKICFEVSELSALSQPSKLVEFIEALKPLRFQFALDDFSGRLPSFLYLKNIPVNYLKLDSTFIKDIANDPIALAVTRSVNDLCHLLGKKTVAKSVENAAVLEVLTQCQVDYAQGYHVGQVHPINQ